jgi:DNA-binding transcriptional LysR family regulator
VIAGKAAQTSRETPAKIALPAYVCKRELRSGELTRVLPGWLAGESTFTALLPHRRGLLPAVKIFVDYLARYLPNTVSRATG